MANINAAFTPSVGTKRSRGTEDEDGESGLDAPFGKKARPTLIATPTDPAPWHFHESINGTSNLAQQQQQHGYAGSQKKYDSDDQSSMISEPGSPQDLDATSSSNGDDMDMDLDDVVAFSQSPEGREAFASSGGSRSPWREQQQRSSRTRTRIATPFAIHTPPHLPFPRQTYSTGSGLTRGGLMHHLQTTSTRSPSQHIRQRHPQENLSSDRPQQGQAQAQPQLLEVPSPIDEDEVPTPPSAAEIAGSQLSMLSVSDIMDIETVDLPAITVHPSRRSPTHLEDVAQGHGMDVFDGSNGTDGMLVIRKQRLRSGAQSHGSMSPVGARLGDNDNGGNLVRRGLSMGFRADCEKCRLRVPGHMNHFVL